MKKLWIALLFILCCALPVIPQQSATANLASQGTACLSTGTTPNCLTLPIQAKTTTASITLAGTFSATIQFEASGDNGATWQSLSMTASGGGSATSATASGLWTACTASLTNVRARASGYVSGTAVATIQTSTAAVASCGGGGGGGSGTVTSVATSAPLSGGPITTTGTISCPTCTPNTTTVAGHALSSNVSIACADLTNSAASCSTDATNASNISSGTLAAARGGAGTVSGALKGNGSGSVSQAACADLSNSTASCSTDATNGSNISSGTVSSARVQHSSGDYTLDQIGNPAAVKTFSLGTNVPLTLSSSGVFTTGAQHESFQSIVGASCPQSVIINNNSTTFVTNGLSGCINIPSGAGVTNGFSVGVMGLAQNNNSSSLGQFGNATAVGVYGAVNCNANNTKCLGSAPQVYATPSLTGVILEGEELGVSAGNTTDTGAGLLLSTEGTSVQPAGDQLPGVLLQTPAAAGTWTSGFQCGQGSIAGGSTYANGCLVLGPRTSSNNSASYDLYFNARNSSGLITSYTMFSSVDGFGNPEMTTGSTSTFQVNKLNIGLNSAVASLPSAVTAGIGTEIIATDAAPSLSGTCVGGGASTAVNAISNGTSWFCGPPTPSTQSVSGADYTNSTVTPSTVFSWTLPATAAAKTYSYSCNIMWESTNTTLVGPVFGVNISAAPTQLTAAAAVQNALSGTDVNGYLSNTTTGSQTLVTGSAAGVTSTNYWARIWGTIEGAATAGSTFIINAASTSGTTATLNIRRGSSCVMQQ